MGIFTKRLVAQALTLAKPTILAILNTPGMTWGPKWVEGYVSVPGVDDIFFIFGEKAETWDPSWGERKDFSYIAGKKLAVTKREKTSTRNVVKTLPWLLEKDEFLYVGGVYYKGLAVAPSGAFGTVDECIGNVVIATIMLLAHQEAEGKEEIKDMQV